MIDLPVPKVRMDDLRGSDRQAWLALKNYGGLVNVENIRTYMESQSALHVSSWCAEQALNRLVAWRLAYKPSDGIWKARDVSTQFLDFLTPQEEAQLKEADARAKIAKGFESKGMMSAAEYQRQLSGKLRHAVMQRFE